MYLGGASVLKLWPGLHLDRSVHPFFKMREIIFFCANIPTIYQPINPSFHQSIAEFGREVDNSYLPEGLPTMVKDSWNRVFVDISHIEEPVQVHIQLHRGAQVGIKGIIIDDISLQPCSYYGKYHNEKYNWKHMQLRASET